MALCACVLLSPTLNNIWAVKTAIDLGLDTLTDAFNRFGI
jgi:hypothetical protein